MSEKRWFVVGLGNPGEKYERTRHNAGFMVIDELARRFNTRVKRLDSRALVAQIEIDGSRVEIAKPQTYMNLSGESVAGLIAKRGEIDRLFVIVDDLALPFGSIRLRRKGSHGGHNGLRSINDCLKTSDYKRLRIGIAPEHRLGNTKKFVLEEFSRTEKEKLPEVITHSADAVESVLKNGIDRAMSEFN